jgi:hypothetical protein
VVREDPAATNFTRRSLLGDGPTDDFLGGYGAPGPLWEGSCCDNVGNVINGQTWLNGVPVDGRSTTRPRTMSVISLVTAGDTRASNFGRARDWDPWWGDLSELIIYDQPLSSTDHKAVEDYLRIRYWEVRAAPGDHQVSLSWLPRPGAARYDVLRSTTSGSGYVTVATGLVVPQFTDLGLDPSTVYYYVVVASGANGQFSSHEVPAAPFPAPASPQEQR